MTVSHTLCAENLAAGYAQTPLLRDLNLSVPDGKVTVLIGPNACGKSTLLKTMARLLPAQGGRVMLDGRSIHSVPTRQLAQQLGLLPQTPIAPEGITVAELVGRGRHPHRRAFRRWSDADYQAVSDALEATNIASLATRTVDELSGGQRQKAWIAMALAQQTDILFLDEPTTYLDIAHQLEILELLRRLNQQKSVTIVMVLHDLNLAARYGDYLIAMSDGAVQASGTPAEVLTCDVVRRVFGLEAQILEDPVTGTPLMVPIGSAAR